MKKKEEKDLLTPEGMDLIAEEYERRKHQKALAKKNEARIGILNTLNSIRENAKIIENNNILLLVDLIEGELRK